MKKLYTTLTDILKGSGYNVADWGEDTLEPDERTLRLEVVEQEQLAASFDM